MRARQRPGLAALFDVAGADGPPRPYHLGFLLGPRINAGGRIGDSGLGVRLLTTRDESRRARSPPNSIGSTARGGRSRLSTLEAAEAEALAALGLEERGACVVVAARAGLPASSASSRRG